MGGGGLGGDRTKHFYFINLSIAHVIIKLRIQKTNYINFK